MRRETDLPIINYATHPMYAGLEPNWDDRVAALRAFSWAFAKDISRYITFAFRDIRRRAGTRTALDQMDRKAATSFQRDGLAAFTVADSRLTDIKKELEGAIDILQRRRASIPSDERTFNDNQLRLSRSEYAQVYEHVELAIYKSGAESVARDYLGRSFGLRGITLQINDDSDSHWQEPFPDESEDIPLKYLHMDTVWGNVKMLLFLTEVTQESGAFRYVPGTHGTATGVWDSLIRHAVDHAGLSRRDPQSRRRFLGLPVALRRKADFGSDLTAESHATRALLDNERQVTSATGDLVLFDPSGFHRGGMVESGERAILQILIH